MGSESSLPVGFSSDSEGLPGKPKAKHMLITHRRESVRMWLGMWLHPPGHMTVTGVREQSQFLELQTPHNFFKVFSLTPGFSGSCVSGEWVGTRRLPTDRDYQAQHPQ